MEVLITSLMMLDWIAFYIYFSRYIEEETIKSIIGWMIASAIMCLLQFAYIMIGGTDTVLYYINICIYSILFVMAVYALIRHKKRKRSK